MYAPAWRCIPASMTSRLHHHLHIESSSLDTIISILCTSSNHCHPWNFDRSSFGCATFNSPMHDNREVVLAVGGAGTTTAEVLDYTQPNPAWTESNYRISANSFRGNYSVLNLTLCTVTFAHSTYRCGNYSREETIQGRKLFAEIRYMLLLTKDGIKIFIRPAQCGLSMK